MARDTDEELKRLQQALLEEEEDAQEDDELPQLATEEDSPIPNVDVYQNFSNDYGKKLRNYASGYRAYNTDKTDTDLESYSEEIRDGRKSLGLLWFLVFLLLALIGIVCAVLWKYLGGIL